MKKITFSLVLALFLLFSGHAQVQVGSGTNVTQNLPINPGGFYTYSQSIYLKSEINASGTITSIQWYYTGTSPLTNSQQLVIYLGTTSKTSFESSYDWLPGSNLTQVYAGGFPTGSAPGWKTITLTTPFDYDGTGNLVVATEENALGSDSSNPPNPPNKFWNFPVIGNRSIGFYSNAVNPNPTTPPTSGTTSYMTNYVPDIIFGGITQACATSYNFTVSNITPTSASISWQPSATSPSEGTDYYYSTSNTTAPDENTTPLGNIKSGTTVDLNGPLLPNTQYYVWVRNNCGSGVSGWSEMTSFTTLCTPRPDFNETFDTTTVPNLPGCWSKILRGSTLAAAATIQTSAASAGNFNSTPNSVYLANAGSTGSYDIILVSPNLSSLSLKTYRLKFYATGLGDLEVGTTNSNLNDATFTPFQPITTKAIKEPYLVDFKTYTGTNTYIAIRLAATATFKTVYLDDIQWEYTPDCPDVSLINVPLVTPNEAKITWTSNGGDSFDIAVTPSNITDPSGIVEFKNSTTTSFTYPELTEDTNYNVWVRSVCDSRGKGSWIGFTSFKTDCLSEPAGFKENFDGVTTPNLPSCWSKILRGSNLSTNAQVTTVANNNYNSEPNSLLLANSSSTGVFDVIAVTPNISSTLSLKTYRLKFYAKGGGKLEIGTLNSNTSLATFTALPGATITTTATYTPYVVDFNTYTGTDSHIGIRLASAANSSVYIDNVVWELTPLCTDVSQVAVTNVTSNSATVTWLNNGGESLWDIAFGSDSVIDPTTLSYKSTDSMGTYTITEGLDPGTNYRVWVRSDCGSAKGEYIGFASFTTECTTKTDLNESFNSTTVPNLPNCWSKILRGSTLSSGASITTEATSSPSNTQAKLFTAGSKSPGSCDIILVSPNLSNVGSGTYRLRFSASTIGANFANPIEIGTLDGNTDLAKFTPLTSRIVSSGKTDYVISFKDYSGTTDQYIGFRIGGTNFEYITIRIDDIVWEPIPLCDDVKDISVPYTSLNSATFTWTPQGSETSWDVAVSKTNLSAADIYPATENSLEVLGLNPGTAYKVWVRSHCPELPNYTYGAWIGGISFNTECDALTTFNENFDSTEYRNLPPCWKKIIRGIGGASPTVVEVEPNSSLSKPNSAQLITQASCPTTADIILIGPSLSNLKAGTNLLTFYSSGNKTLQVGTLDQNSNPASAVFTPFEEINGSGMHDVDFSTYTGTNSIIGFRMLIDAVYASNPYIVLDNIVWEPTLFNDQFDVSQLSYYPNPVKDILNISYINDISSVSVFNLLGQQVLSKSINKTNDAIDVSGLSNGVYLVKVTSDNQTKTIKIVKE